MRIFSTTAKNKPHDTANRIDLIVIGKQMSQATNGSRDPAAVTRATTRRAIVPSAFEPEDQRAPHLPAAQRQRANASLSSSEAFVLHTEFVARIVRIAIAEAVDTQKASADAHGRTIYK